MYIEGSETAYKPKKYVLINFKKFLLVFFINFKNYITLLENAQNVSNSFFFIFVCSAPRVDFFSFNSGSNDKRIDS